MDGLLMTGRLAPPTSINDWVQFCADESQAAGWWNGVPDPVPPKEIAVKIALIHSELSEALEGARKNKMDDHLPHRSALEVELADTLIRIFDLAGACKLELEGAVVEKCLYNRERADHKAEVRAAAGGKKF